MNGITGQARAGASAGAPAIVVRPARPEEAEAVAALYWSVWHETQAPLQSPKVAAFRGPAFFLVRIRNLPQPPLVAEGGGAILGFAGWTGEVINQLFVARDGRSRGIGADLLAGAEAAVAAAGHARATLFVVGGNDRGLRFYAAHGWRLQRTCDILAETADGRVPVTVHEMDKDLRHGGGPETESR